MLRAEARGSRVRVEGVRSAELFARAAVQHRHRDADDADVRHRQARGEEVAEEGSAQREAQPSHKRQRRELRAALPSEAQRLGAKPREQLERFVERGDGDAAEHDRELHQLGRVEPIDALRVHHRRLEDKGAEGEREPAHVRGRVARRADDDGGEHLQRDDGRDDEEHRLAKRVERHDAHAALVRWIARRGDEHPDELGAEDREEDRGAAGEVGERGHQHGAVEVRRGARLARS